VPKAAVVAWAVGLCLQAATTYGGPPAGLAATLDRLEAGIVRVRAVRDTGIVRGDSSLAFSDFEYSTGLIQPDGLILTTKHSVVLAGKPSQNIHILMFGSTTYMPAKLLFVSSDHDIAVLWSPGAESVRLTMSGRKSHEGQPVFVCGYPSFRYPYPRMVLSRGLVVGTSLDGESLEARRDRRGLLAVDAPVTGGQSGSPVLDETLQVVGMITSAFETNDGRWDGRSFFVTVDDLERIISAAKGRLGSSR
jgi:S1-C subfamily serine protease